MAKSKKPVSKTANRKITGPNKTFLGASVETAKVETLRELAWKLQKRSLSAAVEEAIDLWIAHNR